MIDFAFQTKHSTSYFTQRRTVRKGWEQHTDEVIGGGELLRVTIWAVFFYRTAHQIGVYQRNQLSENGLAKKEATFIHVIDFFAKPNYTKAGWPKKEIPLLNLFYRTVVEVIIKWLITPSAICNSFFMTLVFKGFIIQMRAIRPIKFHKSLVVINSL